MASEFMRWLRSKSTDAPRVEIRGWAPAQVKRVLRRLQAGRPRAERFDAVVAWTEEHNVFVTGDREIFISRRLLERCDSDDMVAMLLAHEMAHYELGHVSVTGDAGPSNFAKFVVEDCGASQQREVDADLHRLDRCIAAGFDPGRCLRLYRLLAQVSLDYRDVDGAYGPDLATTKAFARRTHPAVQERELTLRDLS